MAESGLWRLTGSSGTSASFWESSCNVPHGKVPSFCASVFLLLPLLMEKLPRLLALLNGNGRLKVMSILDFPLRDMCLSGCAFRGLDGEGKGEVANTEFSEMFELLLSREQDEEQEHVLVMTGTSRFRLPVVFLSKGCICLPWARRNESSECCFFIGCSSYSFAEEQSSWLRARNRRSFTPTEEKIAGSELRRSKGCVKLSEMSSEEWEWLVEHWIWMWGHVCCVCPVASPLSPSVLSYAESCWCEDVVSAWNQSCVMTWRMHYVFRNKSQTITANHFMIVTESYTFQMTGILILKVRPSSISVSQAYSELSVL